MIQPMIQDEHAIVNDIQTNNWGTCVKWYRMCKDVSNRMYKKVKNPRGGLRSSEKDYALYALTEISQM